VSHAGVVRPVGAGARDAAYDAAAVLEGQDEISDSALLGVVRAIRDRGRQRAGDGPPLRRTSSGRSGAMGSQPLHPALRVVAAIVAAGVIALGMYLVSLGVRTALSAAAFFAALLLYAALTGHWAPFRGRSSRR